MPRYNLTDTPFPTECNERHQSSLKDPTNVQNWQILIISTVKHFLQ